MLRRFHFSQTVLPLMLAFASFSARCNKDETVAPVPVQLGGGEALVYASNGPSTCPTAYPTKRNAGTVVVCGNAQVDFSTVTRVECAGAGIDCNMLYGCMAQRLSLCDATSTTANCGGDGPPVFGCRAVSGCIWFTNGCLANGFDPSSCPVGDICCEGTDGGGSAAYTDFALAGSASDFIDDYGDSMIGLDDAFVLNVVEAEPAGFTGPSITCPAPDAHPFLCGSTTWALVSNAAASPPWFVGRQDFGSYGFTLERRTLASGETKGRVCLYSHVEEKVAACPATPPAEPHCATAGTLTLGTGSGRAEFTYGSGTWVVDFLR